MENKRLRGWRKPVAIVVGGLAVIVGGALTMNNYRAPNDYGYRLDKETKRAYTNDMKKLRNFPEKLKDNGYTPHPDEKLRRKMGDDMGNWIRA